MEMQPTQRFCTNCGQLLSLGASFCVTCGAPMSGQPAGRQGHIPAGAQPGQPGYAPAYTQEQAQEQDDPLLAALAAGAVANRMGCNPLLGARQRRRRPGSTLLGCGCLVLVLAVLVGPFIGVALTSGRIHLIFLYVAGSIVALFFLLLLILMVVTKSGREALLDGIFGGLFGGG